MTDQQVQVQEDTKKITDTGKVAVSSEITPGPWSLPSVAQWLRGLLYAVISATLPLIYTAFLAMIKGNALVIPWGIMEGTAACTAISYLIAKIPQPAQQITTFKKQ